jgi:hypothetical protein
MNAETTGACIAARMTVRGVDSLRVQLARSREVREVIDIRIRLDRGRPTLRFIETDVLLEEIPLPLHILDRDASVFCNVFEVFCYFPFQLFRRKKDHHTRNDCLMDGTAIRGILSPRQVPAQFGVNPVRVENKSHLKDPWPQCRERGHCLCKLDDMRQKVGPNESVHGVPRIGFVPVFHVAISIDPVFQMRRNE